MLEFVPFMIIVVVVVLIVAAWGVARGTFGAGAPRPDLERLPEAEKAFADCLAARGIKPPRLAVYRDPEGGLLIVGPDELDPRVRAALDDCDAELAPRFS